MSWWGKIAGGALGLLSAGPLGMALGAALGHQLDRNTTSPSPSKSPSDQPQSTRSKPTQEDAQAAFFTASFALMGAMAKADGRVTREEIDTAESAIAQMRLTPAMRQTAIDLFQRGKDFSIAEIDAAVAQFKAVAGRRSNLTYSLLQLLLQVAYADGRLDPAEMQLLQRIATGLGIPAAIVQQMLALLRWQTGSQHTGQPQRRPLQDAYQVLGVSANDDRDTVRRAYRKLISRNHPDRMQANGVPEEMIAAATQKTQQITEAWEQIQRAKGW